MSWNHRVIRKEIANPASEDEKYYYEIHEVYYLANGIDIDGWSTEPINPSGMSLQELSNELVFMIGALHKPVMKIVGDNLIEIKENLATEIMTNIKNGD